MNDSTFEGYGAARLRLAGERIADSTRMFFLPWDGLEDRPAAANSGPVSFSHYDYLALSHHPAVVEAAVEVTRTLGTSASASRYVGGERRIHRELETGLARFLNAGDALCLISGYLTNVTLLSHLVGRRDIIFIDELAHNSLFAGARQSGAQTVKFSHNDLADLETKLAQHRRGAGKALIVVESLYSMDGDVLDLPQAIDVKNRHDAWLIVDEAHSFGTLGPTGRGLAEHFGCDPADIEIRTGTLSKAFVAAGGFILGSEKIIRWLRYTLPGFVYSVGLPPATTASALAALAVMQAEPERVARLQDLTRYFIEAAGQHGFDTGNAAGAGIVPVIFRNNDDVLRISQEFFDRGFFVPPVVRIGVPEASPRLRFFMSAGHTTEAIDAALATLTEVAAPERVET